MSFEMLKTYFVLLCILLIVALNFLFVPLLISAADTMLVGLGIFVIIVSIPVVVKLGFSLVKRIDKLLNSKNGVQ